MKYLAFLLLACFLVSGCGAGTHIEQSWRDPDVTVDVSKLNKVLVVALLRDEATRRSTEDKLSALLKGKGVPSYNYLTKDIRRENEASIRERIKNEGFDGVVIMRLADVDKDIRYVQGSYPYPPYYGRFWGYYWNAWNAYYSPGYYQTTKTYKVETNVYSLKRDKLIWSGLTTSTDPANLDKLMRASATTVFKEMKKQGFITGI
ncbi:MAG TPA: hypothetical protein VGC22_01760 [Chitinophaga sp.]